MHATDVITVLVCDEHSSCLQQDSVNLLFCLAVVYNLAVSTLTAVHENASRATEDIAGARVAILHRFHRHSAQEENLWLGQGLRLPDLRLILLQIFIYQGADILRNLLLLHLLDHGLILAQHDQLILVLSLTQAEELALLVFVDLF